MYTGIEPRELIEWNWPQSWLPDLYNIDYGYTNFQEQRWQKRFYVLYNVTSTTAARLECHQDEKSFKTKQPPQHVYSINDVSKIKDSTKQGHNETHKFTFEIVYSSQKKVCQTGFSSLYIRCTS